MRARGSLPYGFRVNPYPGLFVDIEGPDGSGASTQILLLKAGLEQEGLSVLDTKEPTNNIIGGLIRGVLTGDWRLPDEGLQLLFAADRSHHLAREITPVLKEKKVVLTDRYVWSTVAFGSLRLDKEWLLALNTLFFLPDVSIFIRVSPKICMERMERSRFGRELFEEEEKLAKVWRTYEWLAERFPSQIMTVDGEGSKEDIGKLIYQEVVTCEKYRLMRRE